MKTIRYAPATHDYDASYDGQYIGSYPTYGAAETALNAYVFDLIVEGLDRHAYELDGGAVNWSSGVSA